MSVAARLARLEAAAPIRPEPIPLPPAVGAYFDAHAWPRPLFDGYRLGRPLPPESTALYQVYRHCENEHAGGWPVRLLFVQREVLIDGYCRCAYELMRREGGNEARTHHWEEASQRTWGVDHETVTRELRPAERTPLLVGLWRRNPPRDAETRALLGFGPPEVALLSAPEDEP